MLKLLVEVVQGMCVAAFLLGVAVTFAAGVSLMVSAVVVFALLEVRG